ncbi:MAG: hypothetical protein N3I35_10175 [Clostridia bacterium]|nr:hypothetical protein [Clostridia bacterium]
MNLYPHDYEDYYEDDFERQPEPPFGQFGPIFGQVIPGSQFLPGGRPPFGPPPGAGAAGGPPSGPPPSFTPSQATAQSMGVGGPGVYAVDPGAIRFCLYKYSYLWLTNGRQFWAWLTFVGQNSVSGWRWTGYNWRYFGTDLRNIDSFVCY